MEANRSTDDFPALLAHISRGIWIGRAREMAEARELWQQASSGEGQVLFISGDPGVGKTRFVRELSIAANAGGACVFTGECYSEGSTPYAPLKTIIAAYFKSPGPAAIDLPGEILTNLAVLVPSLGRSYVGSV